MALSSALAVRHVRFFYIKSFMADASDNAFCVIVPNFLDIGHTVTQITHFFAIGFFLMQNYQPLGKYFHKTFGF